MEISGAAAVAGPTPDPGGAGAGRGGTQLSRPVRHHRTLPPPPPGSAAGATGGAAAAASPAASLASVQALLAEAEAGAHAGVAEVLRGYTYVGMADGTLCLLQHGTRLYLADLAALSRDMFYQQAGSSPGSIAIEG